MRLPHTLLGLAVVGLALADPGAADANRPAHTKGVKPHHPKGVHPKGHHLKAIKVHPGVDPRVVLQDVALMHSLHAAHRMLDGAAASYGGHRKKAMDQVAFAVADLQREIHKRGHKPQPFNYTVPNARGNDALLGLAQGQLAGVAKQLRSLAASPLRAATAAHVGSALTEIQHALALAKDHAVIHHLRVAHKVLAAADPIYAGHRASAMHQVNGAIGALERELHARGMKDHTPHVVKEPVGLSDLQIKAVHGMLVRVGRELAALPSTGWRQVSGRHIGAAVAELNKALAVARDHVLVAELRSVYHLLDKADGIYKGHRVKAMAQINDAIGNLEREMAVRGLKAHQHVHAWEPEPVSNWQLLRARRHLHGIEARLGLMPSSVHRRKATGHVREASSQLLLALQSAPKGNK